MSDDSFRYKAYSKVSGAKFEPPAPVPARRQLLEESAGLIDGDRNKNYGSPVENFTNTAKLLTARFEHMLQPGVVFTADDVATIQILTKISRMITSPSKKDHWLDIAGYAGCGWECVEEGSREA